jgi:hypothetical protein
MKSFLLALSLAFVLPAFAAEPVTTPSGVKLAKKKEKKQAEPQKKKAAPPKKAADKK